MVQGYYRNLILVALHISRILRFRVLGERESMNVANFAVY